MGNGLDTKQLSPDYEFKEIKGGNPNLVEHAIKRLKEFKEDEVEETDPRLKTLVVGYCMQRYFIKEKMALDLEERTAEKERTLEGQKNNFGKFAVDYIDREGKNRIKEIYRLTKGEGLEEVLQRYSGGRQSSLHGELQRLLESGENEAVADTLIKGELDDIFYHIEQAFSQKEEERQFTGQRVSEMTTKTGRRARTAAQLKEGAEGGGAA